jgi:hypothetical protein
MAPADLHDGPAVDMRQDRDGGFRRTLELEPRSSAFAVAGALRGGGLKHLGDRMAARRQSSGAGAVEKNAGAERRSHGREKILVESVVLDRRRRGAGFYLQLGAPLARQATAWTWSRSLREWLMRFEAAARLAS